MVGEARNDNAGVRHFVSLADRSGNDSVCPRYHLDRRFESARDVLRDFLDAFAYS